MRDSRCLKVKMQFLQENRVKTMTKELDLLYQATIAFYAGNSTQLHVHKILTRSCVD